MRLCAEGPMPMLYITAGVKVPFLSTNSPEAIMVVYQAFRPRMRTTIRLYNWLLDTFRCVSKTTIIICGKRHAVCLSHVLSDLVEDIPPTRLAVRRHGTCWRGTCLLAQHPYADMVIIYRWPETVMARHSGRHSFSSRHVAWGPGSRARNCALV